MKMKMLLSVPVVTSMLALGSVNANALVPVFAVPWITGFLLATPTDELLISGGAAWTARHLLRNYPKRTLKKPGGPKVKTGPTRGDVRSRNKDGTWRKKRSDAGTKRSSS